MRTRIISLLAIFAVCGSTISAQDYDDDIYYNPNKEKKTTVNKTSKPALKQPRVYTTSEQYTYPASGFSVASNDTILPVTTNTMDVDAYNRRGIFASGESTGIQEPVSDDFANTRSIERFYNPQIISESNDADLAAMYYSEPSNVTININTPDYWGYPYYGYYGSYYPRSWWYYNNWYYNTWAWNLGPSWSWGWGPSWNWGWSYPYYYHHHHYRPTWAYRPHGNYRPGYRPSRGSRYGHYNSGTGNYRSGRAASGSYRWGGNGTTRRDNVSGSNGGQYRGSGSSTGGSYRPGRSSSNSSESSYRHSNGSSYRQSGGSYSGGSRGNFGGSRGGTRGGGTGRGRH